MSEVECGSESNSRCGDPACVVEGIELVADLGIRRNGEKLINSNHVDLDMSWSAQKYFNSIITHRMSLKPLCQQPG